MNKQPLRFSQMAQLLLCLALFFNFLASLLPANHSVMAATFPDNSSTATQANSANGQAQTANSTGLTNTSQAQARARQAFDQLPLSFEANQTQTDPKVKYLAHGQGYNLFLTNDQAVLDLRKSATNSNREPCWQRTPDPAKPGEPQPCLGLSHHKETAKAETEEGVALALQPVGASSSAHLVAQQPLAAQSHYYSGQGLARRNTKVANYGQVTYQALYSGIDLSFFGNRTQLEYDFEIAPGSDYHQITLRLQGADHLEVDRSGDLVIHIADIELHQKAPHLYQLDQAGHQTSVSGSYVLKGSQEFGFQVGSYDTTKPLVIDPVLTYLTYLGGSSNETITSVAVDSSGNAYLTGYTYSTDFPVTTGAYQTTSKEGGWEAFVTKLNSTGTGLSFSTYLGGSADDQGTGIAVDSSGNSYVVGITLSADFPITPTTGANRVFQTSLGALYATFVTKLSPSGAVVYSTYLGGNSSDVGLAIAVDSSGQAHVTGYTYSTDFPTTANAYQTSGTDPVTNTLKVFVTKFNANATGLLYSTYLNGQLGNDYATAIALGSSGTIFVSGYTNSTDFPTKNAYRACSSAVGYDAYAVKLNPTVTGTNSLVYATCLGGSSDDYATGIAVDSSDQAYITGYTTSTNFPTYPTTGANPAYQLSSGGGQDAFVVKLNATGNALVYSTYLGGQDWDSASGIVVDTSGNAYIAGTTASSNFTTTTGVLQPTKGAYQDSFVVKLNSTGSQLVYSTFLGGNSYDSATALALGSGGNIYVVGRTQSSDFPTTAGAFQRQLRDQANGFVTKLNSDGTGLIYSTYLGGSSTDVSGGITLDSSGNAYLTGYTHSLNFPPSAGVGQSAAGTYNVFVSKLSADGTSVAYTTYLAGSGTDIGSGIAVDNSGNAYVVGFTLSSDFPTTAGAYQTSLGALYATFVAKLSITGTLTFSTYLGGNSSDIGQSIAVDSAGQAHVAGYTYSTDFPTTASAYQPTATDNTVKGFVTKLNATGTGLLYSTYLNDTSASDYITALALGSGGTIYVTGYTNGTAFPIKNAYQTTSSGDWEAFVTKLDPSQSGANSLVYSTYLGGSGADQAQSIAVDGSGNALVTGYSQSANFPTKNAYQSTSNGNQEVFVTKLNPAVSGASGLLYSSYVGSSGNEIAKGIAVDSTGNIYLAGYTDSATFPTTPGAYQTAFGGVRDGFIVKLSPVVTGSNGLLYATYLGGSLDDTLYGLRLDSFGNAYVIGSTTSSDFASTAGAYQTSSAGGSDIFVAKLAFVAPVFTTQPGGNGQAAGSSLSPQPVVTIKNLDGSTYTGYNGPLTLTIKSGTGTNGATLGGTTTVTAVSGVATFTNVTVNLAGSGYQLTATGSPMLGTVDSAPFNVGGGAQIVVVDGANQSTITSTTFPKFLVAKVLTTTGIPIANQSVTFSAPASGPSGTFAGGGTTYTGTTDANGIITTTAFTANTIVGIYIVIATTNGITATPASFALINTSAASLNDVSLTLTPPVSGPNPISSVVTLTATLTRHGVTPLGGQTVTFTVSGPNATSYVTQTNASGVATFIYSGSFTGTDNVLATTTFNSVVIQSNNNKAVSVYWVQPLNLVTFTSIVGRFYHNTWGNGFSATPSSTPLFTQTFPLINFTQQPGPFTDTILDVNGSQTGSIVAQGNGYSAGAGSEINFDAVFTGELVVTQTSQITFWIQADDTFSLGIGNGATCAGGTCDISGHLTPFQQFPIISSYGSYNYYVYVTINFPQAGNYPFELDYTQQYNQPMAMSILSYATSTSILPAGSVALSPLNPVSQATGSASETFTATVKDTAGNLLDSQPVLINITGANPQHLVVTTTSGVATFVYTGTNTGQDQIQALAFINGNAAYSNQVSKTWTGSNGGGAGGASGCLAPPLASPGLIGSPVNRSSQSGSVSITATQQIVSGTVQYWPVSDPYLPPAASSIITLATNISGTAGAAGATLANLDTTLLSNGAYVIRLCENGDGTTPASASLALINVIGENKPGRVAFSLTDLTIPVAGLPVVVGRSYDSLNRNQLGDFGYGWDLTVSSPRLEVNQAGDVTLTTLDGKRVTFFFTPSSSFFGYGAPIYQPEAGVYGSLSLSPGQCLAVLPVSSGGYWCFPGEQYNPSSYDYRDPYGRLFTISRADASSPFKLTKLQDLNGNLLSFTDTGITSKSPQGDLGQLVQFGRKASNDQYCANCIQFITVTNVPGNQQFYTYTNTTGDLTQVQYPQLMPGSSTAISVTYDYYTSTNLIHLFRQANDPLNHRMVLSEYDASGRLITVTDALNNHTSYTYTLGTTPTTIVTNPDGGVVSTQTDSYGKPTTEMVQVTPTFSRTTTSGYDPLHQLTSKTIAGQLTTNYSYDTGGHQTQLGTVLTAGKSLTTTTGYNAYGGPLSIKDPVSHTWNVGYDDNFMPTVVTDTSGAIGGYSFDGRGSILSRTDGNGKPTSFTYDGYGNKTKETDPLGNSTQYGYDNLGQTTYMTDSLGIATKYNYDPLGHLVSSIQAYTTTTPLTTTFGYDANGNKHTETDALGRTTTYDYDSANRLITTTFPAVSGVVYTGTVSYDWRGNKLSETDQAGHMTKYAYDLAGQLITTTYGLDSGGNPTADTATVVNEYDSVGRKSKEFNPYPGTTLPASWATWPYVGYTYDGAGRLITLTNQLGNATGYGYDDASRKISETNALTNTTSFVYDGRGRLVKTTYPTLTNGTVISTSQGYDGAGNLITKTNELGNTTKYSYDDASRLKNVSIPITQSQNYYQTTSYNYDALGRLKTIIDANLHSTGFEYDVLGRQTKKIWPDNSFEKYDYDGLGNRTSYRLSDGNINTFSYDEWNRLKQGNFFDGRVVTYTYTPTGQRYQVVDSSRGITPTVYSYDNRDRIITATQPSGNKVSYGYDALSNRTSLTTNVGGVISTTQYGYSPASQLLTVTATTDPTGQHTIFSYDPVGRRLQLSLPNGVASHYQYDQLDRLTAITQALGINTPFASYNYELTPVGNRKTITETTNYTGTTVTRNLNYTYDDASRLLSEYSQQTGSPSITTTYQYDAVGNRLLMGTGVLTNTYKFNELDQLTTVLSGTTPTAEYSYKRGNLIQIKNSISNTVTQSYQWDAADRLTSATVYTTSSTTANYSYDADGHRIKQTVGSAVTNYLWDEFSKYGDVALEMDGNNAVTASYVLGTACSCSHALQQLISQKRGGVVNYYLFDAQDNVRVLADSNGTITDQYSYTAFGQLKSSSGTTNNTFRYTGQQFDSLTGLYNLRARYYNPIDGRFLSRDSASYQAQNPVELNRYGYTANNPINFNDPGGYGFEYFTSIFGSPEHAVPLILVAGAAIVVIASLALLLYGNIAPFIISDADEYPDEAKDSPSPEPYADANGGMQGPPCGKSYLDKDTTDLKPMPDGVIISNPSVKSTLQGPYIYVVTLEGKLLLAPQNDLSYHHPDLVNGANVAYAGVMIFSSGKLVSWDNSSGHYKPYAGENETKCIKKWMKDYSGWGFTDEEIGKWMWWLPHQE